ncbi:hypothetical protein, partial [Sulfitobacter sp. 15WGC]|uniref:hypothetical protein n=1 Tax=Sulfitobacter sp. 15WGC TaxID=2575437 RepID=UPI001B7FC912
HFQTLGGVYSGVSDMMVFLVIQACLESGVLRRGCKQIGATKKAAPEGAAFKSNSCEAQP